MLGLIFDVFFFKKVHGLFINFVISSFGSCFRWIIFRRIFVMMGLLYLFRGVCVYVTTLPNPRTDKQCATPVSYLFVY